MTWGGIAAMVLAAVIIGLVILLAVYMPNFR